MAMVAALSSTLLQCEYGLFIIAFTLKSSPAQLHSFCLNCSSVVHDTISSLNEFQILLRRGRMRS